MQRMSNREKGDAQEETINEFLKYVDREIGQWGIYKKSPELQKEVKKNITAGLIQLAGTKKNAIVDKLIKTGIFTKSEMDQALKIPIEKRTDYSLEDLKEAKIQPENLLMGQGLIPATRGYMILSAKTKAGKTLFALNMALCLISGNHFLDIPVMRRCKVFYIYSENSLPLLDDTITKIMKGMAENGIKIDPKDWKNLRFYDAIENKTVFSLKTKDIPKLKKSIDLFNPDIIIIDPIGRIVDFTLNKAENIVMMINFLYSLKSCFWVLIHHDRKKGIEDISQNIDPIDEVRGSTNLTNLADSILCIKPAGEKMPNNFKKIYFSLRRYYDPIPLQVKWDRDNLNYELMDTTDFKRPRKVSIDDLIAFINQNFNGIGYKRDIVLAGAQEFKVSERYLYKLMIEGFEAGKLIKTGDKWEVKEKQAGLFNNT